MFQQWLNALAFYLGTNVVVVVIIIIGACVLA